jgi:hypothetical protein
VDRTEIERPMKVAYLFAEKRTGKPATAIPFVGSKEVATARQFLAHIRACQRQVGHRVHQVGRTPRHPCRTPRSARDRSAAAKATRQTANEKSALLTKCPTDKTNRQIGGFAVRLKPEPEPQRVRAITMVAVDGEHATAAVKALRDGTTPFEHRRLICKPPGSKSQWRFSQALSQIGSLLR